MKEKQEGSQSDNKLQKESDKIHHTHFPVLKIPLKDTAYDSGYEWVDLGNGKLKRVKKLRKET